MDDKNVRKGICKNYGDCDKASSKEIIEVREGEPFECPECHEPLTPVDNNGKPIAVGGKPKKRKPKISPVVYIVGAVLVALLVVVIIYIAKPSANNENGKVSGIDTIKVDTPKVDTPEVVLTPTPPTQEPTETVKKEKPKQEPKPTPPQEPKQGTHKLSYGTWKGGWKNGKPHGQGTLTYSVETVIDSRDPKGRVAQPGEYVIGEWDEGHLVNGRWFKNDKNNESIILGKAG